MTIIRRYRMVRTTLKMTTIQMYLAIFLTMLPIMVTALPVKSLTRDNVAKPNKNDIKIVEYLVRYGHLDDKPDMRSLILSRKLKLNMAERSRTKRNAMHPYTDDEITNGIKSLQNSLGLKISGELNKETMNLMDAPRCGFSDKKNDFNNPFRMSIQHRSRRYTIKYENKNGQKTKIKWVKNKLTWNILIYYKYLTKTEQDDTLEQAFKLWEYSSSLTFTKASNKNPDIRIEFAASAHGDNHKFDGKAGVLAHAFPPGQSPISGDIHFDAAENWNRDYDLLSVALHEVGHSLGLGHSKIYPSVMYAVYKTKKDLHWDDRDGINALYDSCKTKVDSAFGVSGDIYFMRKDMVWKVDEFDMENVFDEGYPKKIKNEFDPKIPNEVDAALLWSDYHIYFLKDDYSWGYDRFKKFIRHEETIAKHWPKIPDNPDASLCYLDKKVTWFFKGNLCWKMDDLLINVLPGYPKKISEVWPGVPDDIDAATYSSWYKETYFFKDTKYWVVNNRKEKQEPFQAYEGGQINQKWKGVCSEKY